LDRLTGFAWLAGFDWVYYEPKSAGQHNRPFRK